MSASESGHREMLLIAKDERQIRVEVATRPIVYRGRHCDVLVVRDSLSARAPKRGSSISPITMFRQAPQVAELELAQIAGMPRRR